MDLLHFVYLRDLQARCFARGHKKWAKALGEELRAFKLDNPDLAHWGL